MSAELKRRIDGRRRVYLLRHGEVSYFDREGKPYAQQGVPLNPEGVTHAEAARAALRGVPLDRAVHTGFPRTRETAEVILRGRSIAVETCEALREVTPGPFAKDAQGPGFEAYFTGAFAGAVTRESTFLGGESFGDFEDRVLPAFRKLLVAPGWKHILIVAHGGTNRMILLHALGAPLQNFGRIEQEAGCINVLDVLEHGGFLVRQVNFTPYSPLKENVWATTMEKIYLDHYTGAAAHAARGEAGTEVR